jgi:hypothetical protein
VRGGIWGQELQLVFRFGGSCLTAWLRGAELLPHQNAEPLGYSTPVRLTK